MEEKKKKHNLMDDKKKMEKRKERNDQNNTKTAEWRANRKGWSIKTAIIIKTSTKQQT